MRTRLSCGVLRTALRACSFVALFLVSAVVAFPQNTAAPQQTTPALTSQTNLVLVRVIVRDAKGNPVRGLTQKDFKLFDNKKQQTISYFHADVPVPAASAPASVSAATRSKTAEPMATARPEKFTALFFDDYHIAFGDLVPVRDAARQYLEKNLDAGARVAIFTASGQPQLAFTADRAKLEEALSQLRINNRYETMQCPKLPLYLAQQAVDDVPQDASVSTLPAAAAGRRGGGPPSMGRQSASNTAQAFSQNDPLKMAEVIAQLQGCPALGPLPDEDMKNRAENIVFQNDLSIQETLLSLGALVHRLSETPGGQRIIALVSDGFFFKHLQYRMDALIEGALRANVVINSLDARGLYAEPPGGNPAQQAVPPQVQDRIDQWDRLSSRESGDTLSEVADGTGGLFVQNTNDMNGGIEKIAALNPASYVLGFTPQSLKLDGKFHSLKVRLAVPSNFAVQARKGYFAPQQEHAAPAQESAMEQAVFSREQAAGLPIQVGTMSKRVAAGLDSLTVTVDADMHAAQFQKRGGSNLAELKLLVVLFDQDGNYIAAKEQMIGFHLPDAALERLRQSGGEASITLPVKPGRYLVRAVLGEVGSDLLGSGSLDAMAP